MIDFDKKLIFVHIPKTGGTSIEAALLQDTRIEDHNEDLRTKLITSAYRDNFIHLLHPHSSLKMHREFLGDKYNDYSVFTVVRNPYERAFSRFCYTFRYKDRNFFSAEHFEDFMELFNFSFRYDTLITIKEEPQLDAILDFQNLEGEFNTFLKDQGLKPISLPNANSSPIQGADYKDFYTKRSRERVEEIFALEICRFGWSFEGRHNGLSLWSNYSPVEKNNYQKMESSSITCQLKNSIARRVSAYKLYSYPKATLRAIRSLATAQKHDGRERVSVSMCSYPFRMPLLKFSVCSLIRQVDKIYIYLNNIDSVPWWLQHPKIEVELSSSGMGDLKSSGKFYFNSKIKGFHFIADDDLIYPGNYVVQMIRRLEKYERKCLICCHGANVKYLPYGYYQHRISSHFSHAQSKDIKVQIGSFGTLLFHTDMIRFTLDDFPHPNLDDLYGSLKARKENLPIVTIARPYRWITTSPRVNEYMTIYSNWEEYEKQATEILQDNIDIFFSSNADV